MNGAEMGKQVHKTQKTQRNCAALCFFSVFFLIQKGSPPIGGQRILRSAREPGWTSLPGEYAPWFSSNGPRDLHLVDMKNAWGCQRLQSQGPDVPSDVVSDVQAISKSRSPMKCSLTLGFTVKHGGFCGEKDFGAPSLQILSSWKNLSDVEEEDWSQDREAHFVRACGVEMHMDISQEPFCVEI